MQSAGVRKMPHRKRKWTFHKGHFKKLKAKRQNLKISENEQVKDSGFLEDIAFSFSLLQQKANQVTLHSGWSHVMLESALYFNKMEKIGEELTVSRSVAVSEDLSWKVRVHGRPIPKTHTIFEGLPPIIDSLQTLNKLVSLISDSSVCIGNADEVFLVLHKSKDRKIVEGLSSSAERQAAAFMEGDCNGKSVDGSECHETVKSRKCVMITENLRCPECTNYRCVLRALVSQTKAKSEQKVSSSNSLVNFRHSTNPQAPLQEHALDLRKDSGAVTVKQ
ncbi:uncharacterized protein [Ptychodera flava]|uniref:uncharacterized protein n=1 Tax=Ptychodera flava TaxID=63121 RepID=UPI00396A03B4